MKKQTKADLHSPEELLRYAEYYYALPDPTTNRGAVLEAITALEAYVASTVFPALTRRDGKAFSDWLEKKTRFDFDARLSTLVTHATGQTINIKSQQWTDYKRAKDFRNKVTHTGLKVTLPTARFVIDTVRQWLAYLAANIALPEALHKLKTFIESRPYPITSERAAEQAVRDFFEGSTAARTIEQPLSQDEEDRHFSDLIIELGENTFVIEVKLLRDIQPPTSGNWLDAADNPVTNALRQLRTYAERDQRQQAILIYFVTAKLSPYIKGVERLVTDDLETYLVFINAVP